MSSIETLVIAFVLAGAGIYAAASLALWAGALRRTPSIEGHPQTLVSVIIPARSEAANVGPCLAALAAQTYPRERWEVIVVDDRSEDGTGDAVRGLAATMPLVVRVIRIDDVPPGWSPKKYALTRAIAESTGEVILTTDADCRPEPGWIAGMVGALGSAHLVAGYSPYDRRGNLAGRLLALETLSQGFLAMSGIGLGLPITCTGRSFGYRRQVFEELGGFGPAHAMLSGDDHLFLQRAVARGFKAVFCDAAGSKVWTDPPATWGAFVQQRIRMFSGARRLSLGVALLGVAVYGWLLALLVGMLALNPVAWAAFLGKVLLDGVSLSIAAGRLGEWWLLRVYPLASVLYLPYFLTFAALGTFGSYRWKGMRGG